MASSRNISDMTYERLQNEPQHLLLKCISGSKAYNLDQPGSDTDYKGIYVLPQHELYGLRYTEQVANETNDEVFYEVGRFVELLCKNNPNILELLASPSDTIVYRHPLISLIHPDRFLSKLCKDSFAGYAQTQIKKAKGLNKKINRPIELERKSVLDFCWIYNDARYEDAGYKDAKTMPLADWLRFQQINQQDCGLSKLPHFRDSYLIFINDQFPEPVLLRGIISGPESNDVQLSSIPEDLIPTGILHFNKDAYSVHCREYREYQEWLANRNDTRFVETQKHGQNYDAKHMMHTFRLLAMAGEIAQFKEIRVHRHDREFLLKIRSGAFQFEELMEMVEAKIRHIEQLYNESDLPELPDENEGERVLIAIREAFYSSPALQQ